MGSLPVGLGGGGALGGSGSGATTSSGFPTALEILNQAQAELGLSLTSVTSMDSISIQMVALLNRACRALTRSDWSHLTKQYSFSPGTTSPYSLPDDYRTMVEQSAWDTTTQVPLQGPFTEQQWSLLVARLGLGNAIGIPFRTWQNGLWLYPPAGFPSGRTIAFEYRSRYWAVSGATNAAPNADKVTDDADVVWFDVTLAVAALKLEFKRAKGFDSTAAQQDFDEAFQQSMDDNADAPILSLNRSRSLGGGLIGFGNIPSGSYGAP